VPGLYLLDVTDARHVRAQRVGDMPLFDRIVDALGLLRHGAVVDIYALGNPRMPRRIASYRAAGTILDLSVEQSRLWLLVEGGGVELVDLSHPASPKRLAASGNVDMPQAAAVAAKGDWCYVVESGKGWAGPDHGMHVLHRRGDRLVHVRHLQWPRTNLQRMVIDEHAAYVTDKFYGVWRFDLTHPEQPQPQALFMSAGEIQQLLADGPVALANLEWGGTVAILDISDPLHIRLRGYYRPGRFDDYAVALYGRYFYYGKGKIRRIVDIHDPSHPLEVGSWRLPGNPLMPPLRRGVRMFQWLQTDQGRVLLSAWNIGNPLHPQLRGMLLLPPDLIADYGAAAAGGGRMFAVANDVVVAIDIHDPVHMRLLGKYREAGIGREAHYQWQGAGQRAVLNGDALYILQGSEALDRPRIAILDVSRPQRMHRVGRTPLTPPAFQEDWFDERLLHQGDMLNDMVRSGDLLFVSDYWGGVRIYDLQRPLHPQLRWWEFSPYLALMPEGWSRAMYKRAVASGRLHRTLRLDDRTWALRHVIGRRLESQPLVYHPGYELFGWNIGAVVGDYLLQPKLGGIAVTACSGKRLIIPSLAAHPRAGTSAVLRAVSVSTPRCRSAAGWR